MTGIPKQNYDVLSYQHLIQSEVLQSKCTTDVTLTIYTLMATFADDAADYVNAHKTNEINTNNFHQKT